MNEQRIKVEGYVFFGLYIACIFLANWFISPVGVICVGENSSTCLIPMKPQFFGDGMVPSGVLFVGVSLTLRDLVQRRLGFNWSFFAVIIGALLSALVSPSLALASGVAFLLSETLDLFVYTPISKTRLITAVVASNFVGLVVDSVLFLSLAGIPLIYMEGQIIGKIYMTILAIPVIYLIKKSDDLRGIEAA